MQDFFHPSELWSGSLLFLYDHSNKDNNLLMVGNINQVLLGVLGSEEQTPGEDMLHLMCKSKAIEHP